MSISCYIYTSSKLEPLGGIVFQHTKKMNQIIGEWLQSVGGNMQEKLFRELIHKLFTDCAFQYTDPHKFLTY